MQDGLGVAFLPGKRDALVEKAADRGIPGEVFVNEFFCLGLRNPDGTREAESLPVTMLLQVHDELVFELPQTEAESHAIWIKDQMSGAISLDVPMKVDVTIAPTWLGDK